MNDPHKFRYRCENDSGYLARNVLGYNYFKDEETGEVTYPGGILPDGPYEETREFLDDDSIKAKHLESPRGSLKTTQLISLCTRKGIKDRNIRVLYGMETYSNALKTLDAIRDHFDYNDRVKQIWGDLRSNQWSREAFSLKGRTRAMREPTYSAFGVDKVVVGGHWDIIIADDLVSWNNVRNKEGMQKVLDCFKMLQPLLDPGGILIIVGTRYHDDDLYGHLLGNLQNEFSCKVIDCGMQLEKNDKGGVSLVGTPIFEHLSETFLKMKLGKMQEADFSSQYLNTCLSSAAMIFHRGQFEVMGWEPFMANLSCYIVTDSAVSERLEGCYSTASLVGLDSQDNAYVLDTICGHFNPAEYVAKILDMQEKWQSQVNIHKILMEKIAMNEVFKSMMTASARDRQMRINVVDVPRSGNDQSKDRRIRRLSGRFERRAITFVTTIPRYFTDLGEDKPLFDPEGFTSESGDIQPDGEIVREFVRFPVYGKNDIADSLADIDALDSKGARLCSPGIIRKERKYRQKRIRRGQIAPMPLLVNGRVRMVDVATPQAHNAGGPSWLSQYQHGGNQ